MMRGERHRQDYTVVGWNRSSRRTRANESYLPRLQPWSDCGRRVESMAIPFRWKHMPCFSACGHSPYQYDFLQFAQSEAKTD